MLRLTPINMTMASLQQQQQGDENPTATWIRKKLRANEPFLLDELTPSGVKLFVALGWPDDEKSNGYAAAKDKVAKRVPAQDWSFIQDGPETCPEKSRGKWGGFPSCRARDHHRCPAGPACCCTCRAPVAGRGH